MKNLVIKGNSKMGKQVGIFNLPPKQTCTPTKWCLTGYDGKPRCYALRNNFLLPNVIKGAGERFYESARRTFVAKMVREIKDKYKYVRIHSSGDFYSEEYIEKWIEIAKQCPNTLFRGTTRRIDLKDKLKELNRLSNVIIRESLDPTKQKATMGLKVAMTDTVKTRRKNVLQCENDCETCGHKCWRCHCDMMFKEH